MARAKVQFICRECGGVQARWAGKCPDCGTWDALEEHRGAGSGEGGADRDKPRGAAGQQILAADGAPKAVPISQVTRETWTRWGTGIRELDRVLGGSGDSAGDTSGPSDPAKGPGAGGNGAFAGEWGVVPGSTILVGGDPGIGKSTLLLQAADRLARGGPARRPLTVLYVSSEESAQQTRLRAERLGVGSDNLLVLADTNLARIIEQARKTSPAVVVIDSIQMIYKGDIDAAPGSVSQLRTCCMELVYLAKATGMAIFLVGHVTKRGQLAGPKLLEHMVDTVLYFEGDRYHSHRIVRGIKNRYGTTLEVGLFEMSDAGLREVAEGSGLVAAEYQPSPGSVVCPVLQGSRCLLIEIQALTATGFLGAAKRKTSGVDGNRLAMLIAVLEKHGGLRLADQDIFASSVGGVKVVEPAADLAVAMAIAGAHLNRRFGEGDGAWCAVGEIGLGGEIRHVNGMGQRLAEAARLGFAKIVCPKGTEKALAGCELVPITHINMALQGLS